MTEDDRFRRVLTFRSALETKADNTKSIEIKVGIELSLSRRSMLGAQARCLH